MNTIQSSIVFPDARQLLLIKALTADDKDFTNAWQAWKVLVPDFQKLDDSSLKLFPLVYKRLERLQKNDSLLLMAKNAYRFHWLRNSLLIHSASEVLHLFSRNNIPCMVLKGGAFLYLYYNEDIGSRNLEDIDIFVPITHFFSAIALLKDFGWSSDVHSNEDFFEPTLFHAISLKKETAALDLHCHVFHGYLQPDDWSFLAAQAQSTQFDNNVITTLPNSDHLVHVCAHGLRWSASNQHRWIIDALQILNKGNIDWDRVIETGLKMRAGLPLSAALQYIHDELKAEIPASVLLKLKQQPYTLSEKRLFLLGVRDTMNNPVYALEKYWWRYYVSLTIPFSFRQAISQLRKYLVFLCQTSSMWKIPGTVIHKLGQLLTRSVARRL